MTPEQTKLALTLADGSLAVMGFVTRSFNPDGSVHFEREVNETTVQAECAKAQFDLVSWRIITDADLPGREYRNAWRDTGVVIDHDMGKAREIHRDKLRAERAPLLAALDVEYQRADETNDAPEKAKIAGRKQKLRDVTADPRIDKAKTVSDLAAVKIDARVLDW